MSEYQGKHVAPPAEGGHEAIVEQDEATGTPPRISARTRTAVYVSCLVVEVASLLALGVLTVLGVLPADKALQLAGLSSTAVALVSSSLSVGYRPTRPGSPVAP